MPWILRRAAIAARNGWLDQDLGLDRDYQALWIQLTTERDPHAAMTPVAYSRNESVSGWAPSAVHDLPRGGQEVAHTGWRVINRTDEA